MEKTGKLGAMLLLFFCVAAMAEQTPNWTQQSPQTSPSARSGHAMAYDSVHGQVVLFGGSDGSDNLLNDTWVWDGAHWTQKSSQTSPPARSSFGMAYDSASGQVVLFGGFGGFGNNGTGGAKYLADTWVWDGVNWTQKLPQASPPADSGFPMVYDSTHSEAVMFNNDLQTWVWNGTNWIEKFPQPVPSVSGAMAYDSAESEGVLLNEIGQTWVWNGVNWRQEFPQTTPPGGEPSFDSALGQVVLFGGQIPPASGLGNFTSVNDTWVWNGSNWIQQFPATSPPAQSGFALAYDSGHSQVVLFGSAGTWTYGVGAPPPSGPSITGVVSASAFGAFSSVAPGSWVEIYGSNLAPDMQGWTGADFKGTNAPTMLNGVSVSIGGQAAFVDYISPTQVNAQLPSNIAVGGPLQLTVTNGSETSAPVNVTVNPTEPGLLAPASFKIGGNQYVVAQHSDGSYVLAVGAIPGLASSPAKPGETVVIYGVGFGPVTPNIPAGEIATETNQLSASFQILFGKTSAKLPYYGLAPNFVGLYQFNVTVPAVADNDLVPLTFNLGGEAGTQTLFTAVQQ
jgi:uncharacterized protein (TIGR03437 family)